MARHDVTTAVQELMTDYGYTYTDLCDRFRSNFFGRVGEDRYEVSSRNGEGAVLALLRTEHERDAEKARQADLKSSRKCEWRKISYEWVIVGQFETGQVVTVTRRNGSTSQEVIGVIVGTTDDGLTMALPGRLGR
ncbi:MAG: hypothetical protein FWF25_06195 [Propionibacteriaceae bacterium]|nr:hypothetical protein [Propionibacteriaceae bacterium]